MEGTNVQIYEPIEINYTQFAKKDEALKRKWSENKTSRKLSKSGEQSVKIPGPSNATDALLEAPSTSKKDELASPSDSRSAGVRSTISKTVRQQERTKQYQSGMQVDVQAEQICATNCCFRADAKASGSYPKTSTNVYFQAGPRRTSTPLPIAALSDPINESYDKFRQRLEKPLSRKIHRGIQLEGTSFISSHMLLEKYPAHERNYVITFPEQFDLEKFEAEQNAACTSGNWDRLFENHIEQHVYYIPYVYHVPAYYSEMYYYPYVQYHPYYYPAQM